MTKAVMSVLLIALVIAIFWWMLIATYQYVKRQRDKRFQETLELTIKADVASERLEAAELRARKRTGVN